MGKKLDHFLWMSDNRTRSYTSTPNYFTEDINATLYARRLGADNQSSERCLIPSMWFDEKRPNISFMDGSDGDVICTMITKNKHKKGRREAIYHCAIVDKALLTDKELYLKDVFTAMKDFSDDEENFKETSIQKLYVEKSDENDFLYKNYIKNRVTLTSLINLVTYTYLRDKHKRPIKVVYVHEGNIDVNDLAMWLIELINLDFKIAPVSLSTSKPSKNKERDKYDILLLPRDPDDDDEREWSVIRCTNDKSIIPRDMNIPPDLQAIHEKIKEIYQR